MCRDGYRAECATDGCDEEVRCRDYTHCPVHRDPIEDWDTPDLPELE